MSEWSASFELRRAHRGPSHVWRSGFIHVRADDAAQAREVAERTLQAKYVFSLVTIVSVREIPVRVTSMAVTSTAEATP